MPEQQHMCKDKELVERTLKPLFTRYNVSIKTGAFSSLVEVVLSIAGHQATSTKLKATAIQQMNHILQLRDYASKNYDMYMNWAWGRDYAFTVAQSIDDYICAYHEFECDFHPPSYGLILYITIKTFGTTMT